MKRFLFASTAALAMVGSANAVTILSATTADTLINGGSLTSANTSRNGDLFVTAFGTTSQAWAKFSGSTLKAAIGGGTLNSLSLRVSATDALNNSSIEFYINSNAAWTLPATGNATNQDAATTPFLIYNNSGQPNATNARFLGTNSLISTFAIANRNDVLNKVIDIPLSTESALRTAINSGVDFTLFAKVVGGAGRLSFVSTEGVPGFTADGRFGAQTVVPFSIAADVTPVPEPASMAALGLGLAAFLRRRKAA